MSNVAIKVENLGKKYLISHENTNGDDNFREVIVGGVKKIITSLTPFIKTAKSDAQSTTEDFWALDDVNFSINKGDKVGIIGRNGAGKSTLLKVLSRITEPTTGKIHINGRIASLLEVGTGFHPELTGRENIYLNGAILGMSRKEIKEKFDEIVTFAEVDKFLDTPVKRYSSGMYVRLAFSVAAHLEPEILVVDEVLAVGDVAFQKKCLGKMDEVSKDGRTILFVSHNMDAITALCNKGVILDSGNIVFDGSSIDAREKYLEMSTTRGYSIGQHSGRGGSGKAHIKSVKIVSKFSDNNEVSPLIVNLKADISDILKFRNDIQIAFGIDAEDGTRLFTFLSEWIDFKVDLVSGHIDVNWTVNSFPLIPARYLISATILFQGETLDSIQHCAFFDVPVKRGVHVERLSGWGHLDLECQMQNL